MKVIHIYFYFKFYKKLYTYMKLEYSMFKKFLNEFICDEYHIYIEFFKKT